MSIVKSVSIFVVSLNLNESCGADRMCYNKTELDSAIDEYKVYLKNNKFKGKINIHQYDSKNYPKEIFKDEQIFFDNFFDPTNDVIKTIVVE